MPKSTDYQFSSEEPREERNPYAVLNVAPVMISDLRDQLSSALEALRKTDKVCVSVSDDEEMRNANIVKIETELKRLETQDGSGEVDPKKEERKVYLQSYLQYYREYLALRNAVAPQEKSGEDMEGALDFVSLLPEDDEVASVSEHISRAQVEHMREFFRDTIASLSKTLAHPRKSKKYRDLENALEAVNEILEKESVVGGLSTEQRERLDQLFNVLQVIEAILNIDQNIHGRFRALAQQFHPDANPGDAMAQEHFKEASTAYRKLTDANEEKRKAFAMNLVFGQRTELWTNEMKEVAEPIAMQLAPVFALEKPMRGETVPCDECNGSGNVAVQKQDDYFPVPVVCEGCDGAGAVPKSVHELRKALESLEQEDGKEYETERDDEYDEEDYEYEDDEYDDDEDY